ncbi:MAG: ABC transporter ATP-binding protein [Pararhizobium sp.]
MDIRSCGLGNLSHRRRIQSARRCHRCDTQSARCLMTSSEAQNPLVKLDNLQLSYIAGKSVVQAVRSASLTIAPGEAIGLVGESGSGKSTLARSLLGLNNSRVIRIDNGSIKIQGREVASQSEKEWQKMRGAPLAMVFQDPLSFLNPVMRIEKQVAEGIRRHDASENVSKRIEELLSLVKLPTSVRRAYPHELSGGMRQRVLLAIALACRPKLLVADEPTTALDVTTQAEIMALLGELRQNLGMALLLISHDLGLVAAACDRIYVMYAGRTVECGLSQDILKAPAHPYTRGLFDSARALRLPNGRFATIGGEVPNLAHFVDGCPFRPRCSQAHAECMTMPEPASLTKDHWSRCWVAAEENKSSAMSGEAYVS